MSAFLLLIVFLRFLKLSPFTVCCLSTNIRKSEASAPPSEQLWIVPCPPYRITFTAISRLVFDQTTEYHRSAKLTQKMNYLSLYPRQDLSRKVGSHDNIEWVLDELLALGKSRKDSEIIMCWRREKVLISLTQYVRSTLYIIRLLCFYFLCFHCYQSHPTLQSINIFSLTPEFP